MPPSDGHSPKLRLGLQLRGRDTEEGQGNSAEGNPSARPDVEALEFLSPAPRGLGQGSDSTPTTE